MSPMLFATGSIVRYARRERARWLVSTGAAIGLVGALRWDFGLYCGLVFAIALVSIPFIGRAVAPPSYEPIRLRVVARRFVVLLVPAVMVALPFYAPALLTDPRAILRSVEIALNVNEYGGRALPWPSFVTYQAYAFPLIGLANVIAVVVALRMKLPAKPSVPLLLHTQITTLLGACLLFYASSRADVGHLTPPTVFALLSLPLVFWLIACLRAVASARASVLR